MPYVIVTLFEHNIVSCNGMSCNTTQKNGIQLQVSSTHNYGVMFTKFAICSPLCMHPRSQNRSINPKGSKETLIIVIYLDRTFPGTWCQESKQNHLRNLRGSWTTCATHQDAWQIFWVVSGQIIATRWGRVWVPFHTIPIDISWFTMVNDNG